MTILPILHSVRWLRPWAVAGSILFLGASTLAAQTTPTVPPDPADAKEPEVTAPPIALTQEDIEAQIKEIEGNKELDDETRTKVVEAYRKVLKELELAGQCDTAIARYTEEIASAPKLTENLKAELAKEEPEPSIEPSLTLPQLEQQLVHAEAELAELQKKNDECEAAPKRRADRRIEAHKRLADIKSRIDELQKLLDSAPAGGAPLVMAKRVLNRARHKTLVAESQAIEKELQSYDTSAEWLPLERDLAARRRDQAERQAKLLREVLNQRRADEVEQQVAESREAAAQAHPAVRAVAEENTALAKRREQLTAEIGQTGEKIQAAKEQLKLGREEFERSSERLKRLGVNATMGSVLHKQRTELPDVRKIRKRVQARQQQLGAIQSEIYQCEDERRTVNQKLAKLDQYVADIAPQASGLHGAVIERTVKDLLQRRRDYWDTLVADYERYFRDIVELDSIERELIDETLKFTEFIDRHVLWVPSTSVLVLADVPSAIEIFAGMTTPTIGQGVLKTLRLELGDSPLWIAFGGLVFLLLLWSKRRLRFLLQKIGRRVAEDPGVLFQPTVVALGATLVIASAWPFLLYFVGWRLSISPHASMTAMSLGSGMQTIAVVLLVLEVTRQVCRPGGLAEAHFGWPSDAVRSLRRRLRLVIAVSLPLILVVAMIRAQNGELANRSLGRMIFIAGMLLAAGLLPWIARPLKKILHSALAQSEPSSASSRRWFWSLAIVPVPLALALLAWSGYYYTAQQLAWRLFITLAIGLTLLLIHGLLVRYLTLAKRQAALSKPKARSASPGAEILEAEEAEESEGGEKLREEQLRFEIRQLVRRLMLMVGLIAIWAAWVDILPALRIFEQKVLWETEGGQTITAANLGLAVLIAVITIVVARNLPYLMEMTLLARLPLDPGGRYAIASLSRYLISIVGVISTASQLGIRWSSVQWLVAAMTVGLGFGLQEVFANFVCGLIILFERPVRVGDIVTVGDMQGRVTKIRIRAITILDADRRELLVPNKQFITGNLINWTLSDPTTRVVIKVGIAYGSNTARARSLLLKVARENPLVMSDPAPTAIFCGFGATALDFELGVFLANRELFGPLVDTLHTQIDHEFRKAEIDITFPQRNTHVRPTPPTVTPALPPVNEKTLAAK